MVLLRLIGSHEISCGERLEALRIVGRSDGQSTVPGTYPLGASGVALPRRCRSRAELCSIEAARTSNPLVAALLQVGYPDYAHT